MFRRLRDLFFRRNYKKPVKKPVFYPSLIDKSFEHYLSQVYKIYELYEKNNNQENQDERNVS